jgi:hypothetical protein
MRLHNVWVSILGVTLAASVAGNVRGGGGTSSAPAGGVAPAAGGGGAGQKVDAATAGEVTGMVMVDGTTPKNDSIKMNADPVCVKENPKPQFQETYEVGADGKSLGNVFIYVKDGLGNYEYDPPTTNRRSIKGCRAVRVQGLRVSALEIINSDPTLHNITPCRRATRSSATASRSGYEDDPPSPRRK